MQKIRIDFDNPGLPQHISAVENDSQSRFFQATLYENGKAYTAPEGATYSIMYRGFGPQNQGWYDTINDGAGKRAACAVSGNVVTCEIARQALQVPGHVSIVLCVTTGKGYMLKSWPIECDCKNDRYDSTAEIQSFFYITQVTNADWTQAIQAWENLKDAIDPTLSVSGKAADAKETGDKIGELKEDIKILKDSDVVIIYKDAKFPVATSTGFSIVGSSGLYISNLASGSRIEFDFETIANQIPNYTSWDTDTKTFTLELGNSADNNIEYNFGYDFSTGAFKVVSIRTARPASFVSLFWRYYGEFGGRIYEDAVCHSVAEIKEDIKILKDNDVVIIYKDAKFPVATSTGFSIVGSSGLYISNLASGSRIEFDFETIANQIPNYTSWDTDTKTFTLELGNSADNNIEYNFGYDFSTGAFKVVSIRTARPASFVSLFWRYYGEFGGRIYEDAVCHSVAEIKDNALTFSNVQNQSFNSSLHEGAKDFATICKKYSILFNGDEKNGVTAIDSCEAFLWFTDPHLFTAHTEVGSEPKMEEYIAQLQKYYNSTPTTFALCGGDWLGKSDIPEMACYKMGYINGICRSMFDKCYMLVGNHDTNYQGKKDAESSSWTTRLSKIAIRNLWYRDIGHSYYDFEGVNTHFYCFDTGTENQSLTYDNNYGYEQALWFAENLKNEKYTHVAIAAHIYCYRTIPDGTIPDDVQPLTRLLLQIASAYNNRTEINVNGTNFDFSAAAGRVDFMLAGHSHADYTLVDSGITVIATLDCGNHQSYSADCSFDLVFVDYDHQKITCIRAGVGEDREINLDNQRGL